MTDHIEHRARALVCKWGGIYFGLAEMKPERVTLDARFYEDLKADSLDNVELIMAFEEEFGIEISDDAAARVTTFGDAVRLVHDLIGSPSDHSPGGTS